MKPAYRNNSLYLSDEVLFYVKLEAKRLVGESDASMTLDQCANGLLREVLTTREPSWVIKWDDMQKAKQAAKKRYQEIENG